MNRINGIRILAALMLALLILAPLTAGAQGEPVETIAPNCHLNNPNYHMLRSIDATSPTRTVCTYGARAVSPCQAVSPKGLLLQRAVIKLDGRIKCFYAAGG